MQCFQVGEYLVNTCGCLEISLQVGAVVGDDVPTLADLRILEVGQEFLIFQVHILRMHNILLGLRQIQDLPVGDSRAEEQQANRDCKKDPGYKR